MLLELGVGFLDEVRRRSELCIGEDRGAVDAAISCHQIKHCVEVRPERLADECQISERECAARKRAPSFVTYRRAGNGITVVVSAWDIDIQLDEEGVPVLDCFLENFEDRSHPCATLSDIVVARAYMTHLKPPNSGQGDLTPPAPHCLVVRPC